MGTEFSPPSPAPPPSPYPPYGPPPPPRRLARSTRERMWAGVAGGMAEYFDLDPALVRLLWVAAAVVSGGLAVPIYILAWIILPRDDRPPESAAHTWRDWSQEFHTETQRLADEARRVADEARGSSAASDKGAPTSASTAPRSEPAEWWQSDRYVERPRTHRHPRSTGIVLVGLGILLLAANAGLFSFIEWRTMWPLIFIGLGVVLLARQSGWNR
jgi:phage shock protein C